MLGRDANSEAGEKGKLKSLLVAGTVSLLGFSGIETCAGKSLDVIPTPQEYEIGTDFLKTVDNGAANFQILLSHQATSKEKMGAEWFVKGIKELVGAEAGISEYGKSKRGRKIRVMLACYKRKTATGAGREACICSAGPHQGMPPIRQKFRQQNLSGRWRIH